MARKVIEPLVQTSIRLYQSDYDVIQRKAAEEQRDAASVIRKIVNEYVKAQAA